MNKSKCKAYTWLMVFMLLVIAAGGFAGPAWAAAQSNANGAVQQDVQPPGEPQEFIGFLPMVSKSDGAQEPQASGPQPANIHLKINFQTEKSTAPAGFLPDVGAAFGSQSGGSSYGWNADNRAGARDQNAPNSPAEQYDTFNHMQKYGNYFWEIALPNGTYQVAITAGDPTAWDSTYKIAAEGKTIVSGTPSSDSRWVTGSAQVSVWDGRLTIKNGSGARNNKINFIEIDSPNAPTQTPPPVTTTPVPTQVPPTPNPATPPPGQPASATRFGSLAVIPGSSGSLADPEGISALKTVGAQYMRLSLEWVTSEPERGKLSFDTRSDYFIQRIENAGLRVFPTLYVGAGWMNSNAPGQLEGGSRSYPPDDLGTTWSDATGYSPTYYNFVYSFFSHYRGHFDYAVIENEANSALFWGGTADQYLRLLKTASKAIRAADPAVRILDSGFVSSAIGICMADDFLKTGARTLEQTTQFAIDYYRENPEKYNIQSSNDLLNALNRSATKEQCSRISTILDGMGGLIDIVNFHFYENSRSLPEVAAWLKARTARAGYNVNVATNEIGERGDGITYAESAEHARMVFKKMVTARSLGLEAMIWFSADTVETGKDKVGLFGAGGVPRLAGQTYAVVTNAFGPGYTWKETRSSGPSLVHHVFQNAQGTAALEALWMETGQQTVQVSAPAGVVQAVVTQYSGASQTLAVSNGQIQLALTADPVFVTWK